MSTNSLLGQLGDRMPFPFYLDKNFVGHSYPVQSAGCVVELKGQYRFKSLFASNFTSWDASTFTQIKQISG